MFNLQTISGYLFRLYAGYFLIILLLFVGVLVLSNTVDILQKFKTVAIPFSVFWKFALYKVPYLLNEAITLISFISMTFFWQRIVRYNELVVIISSGIPIWRVVIIAIITTFCIGVVSVTVINPISAFGLDKYDQVTAKLTNKKSGDLIISKSGILSFEEYANTKRFIRARSLRLDTKELYDVTMVFLSQDNQFLKRVDAKNALLDLGELEMYDVTLITDAEFQHLEYLSTSTTLAIEDFKTRMIIPENVSFWQLPGFISKLSASGLPTEDYKMRYYRQLFKPLNMIAMVLLASCFLRFRQRLNSYIRNIGISVLFGVVTFLSVEVVTRLLIYSGIPPMLGVLLPIILIIFISNFIVLHLHEA